MIYHEDTMLTQRAHRLGLPAGTSVLLLIDDAGTQRYGLDTGGELIDLGISPADASTRLRELAETGLPQPGDLTPSQAVEYHRELTGKTTRRQLWHRWAGRGDVPSKRVLIIEERTYIPRAAVQRVAREGPPAREPGRPRG